MYESQTTQAILHIMKPIDKQGDILERSGCSLSFRARRYPYCGWLHVDAETLKDHAESKGTEETFLDNYKENAGDIMMKRFVFILFLLITFMIESTSFAKVNIKDFNAEFNNFKGTIVVYDRNADNYIVYNAERSKTRYSPFSTYKIPHSVVALETGVISDIDQIYKWDTKKYPQQLWWPGQWAEEHNLRTAIKYSVVPFYRNIANQIGYEKMKHYVDTFNYGNKDISSGLDSFWLNGSLKISAEEQIEFLKKFYDGKLGVAANSIEAVKKILIQEETTGYTLSAKTGGGNIDGEQDKAFGWYVGYVEKDKNVYFFALNIEGKNFKDILNPRIEITKSILRKLQIIH